MVERDLAKVDVAGSTPVSRSRHFQARATGFLQSFSLWIPPEVTDQSVEVVRNGFGFRDEQR